MQTSLVSFSYMEEDAKGSYESPAQLTLAQGSQGCCAEVLSHPHQTAGTAVCLHLVSLAMKPEWERHLRVLLPFLFRFFFKERGLLHMLKQKHFLLNP